MADASWPASGQPSMKRYETVHSVIQSRTGLRSRFSQPAPQRFLILDVFAASPPAWGQIKLVSRNPGLQPPPGPEILGDRGLRQGISCSTVSYSCPGCISHVVLVVECSGWSKLCHLSLCPIHRPLFVCLRNIPACRSWRVRDRAPPSRPQHG